MHAAAQWFAGEIDAYRRNNLVHTGVQVPDDADEQDHLLAAFGRDPDWAPSA